MIQDHEVRQGERCSGAVPIYHERWLEESLVVSYAGREAITHVAEGRPRSSGWHWAADSSHVSSLAEMGRVFQPDGRKR